MTIKRTPKVTPAQLAGHLEKFMRKNPAISLEELYSGKAFIDLGAMRVFFVAHDFVKYLSRTTNFRLDAGKVWVKFHGLGVKSHCQKIRGVNVPFWSLPIHLDEPTPSP